MTLYSRNGTLYLTYYHGSDRIRKSTGLTDTAKNRKFIKNEVIPKLEFELRFGITDIEIPDFDHYAQMYVNEQRHRLKPNTFARYCRILENEVLPSFGGRKINQIRASDIRIWTNRKLGKALPVTVAEKLTVLRKIFRYAFEDEVIMRNPVDLISLPKSPMPDIEPLTVEEANYLLEHANGWYRNYLAMAFYTGMRVGELLALKWSDVDFNKRKIHVRRSISKGIETSPKTTGSVRIIPIFDRLWSYIRKQFSITGLSHEYIFVCPKTNLPYHDATSLRDSYWLPLLKRTGIPHRQQKNTRHTFAVQMLNSGTMKITDISRMMGHTSTQMLLTRYAKFVKSEEIKIESEHDIYGHNSGTVDNVDFWKVVE